MTTTCPPEIVVLLDHAMEAGHDLVRWPGYGETPAVPMYSISRAREGSGNSDALRTWTVGVAGHVDMTCLEWREGESRWVGLKIHEHTRHWTRFYEGPRLIPGMIDDTAEVTKS